MALVHRSRSSTTDSNSNPDPTSSLREALDKFEAALTASQKQQLRATAQVPTASSVIEFVTKVDLDSKNRAGRCVASRLCTFLDATQQFSGVVSTFVSSNPATAALVWGSVKFAILAASNVTSYFEKITALLMRLGKFCPTYEKFAHLFPGCPELQSALCDYFAVAIRLSTRILQVSQRPALTQIFTSVLTTFESEFMPFQNDLRQASQIVSLSISLASQMAMQQACEEQKTFRGLTKVFHSDARREFAKADRWRNERAEREERKLRVSVKENLSTIDHLKPWRQAQRERVAHTAEWFKDDEGFRNWQCEAASCILWCSGTMGTGKTVLASQVIAHLFESRNQTDIIAFYFCRSDHRDSLLPRKVLGSLARQMLDTRIDKASADELQDWSTASKDLDEHDLVDFLICNLEKRRTYYLIIDGLDECEEEDIRRLSKSMERLLSQSPGHIKLLNIGRPESGSVFSKHTTPQFKLSFTKASSRPDLRRYIDTRLEELIELGLLNLNKPKLIVDIAKNLEKRSEGMFLWTRMLLDELCSQNSDNDIMYTLEHLPRTMSELLDRKFSRIEKRKGAEKAIQTLQYCGVTKRPLASSEFQELLGVSIGQQSFDAGAVPNNMSRVISDCSGLVFEDEEDSTIHYVHHSIKEYLFATSQQSPGKFVEDGVDMHVGFLSLTYLNYSDLERQVTKRSGISTAALQPLDLALSPIALSSEPGTNLARLLLHLQRKRSRASHEYLTTQMLRTTNPLQATGLLDKQFKFLEYARNYWIYHLAGLNPDRHSQMWRLFSACVEGKNPWAVRPFEDNQAEMRHPTLQQTWAIKLEDTRPFDYRYTLSVIQWALFHGHGALAFHEIEPKGSLLAQKDKAEMLWSMLANIPAMAPYVFSHFNMNEKFLQQTLLYAVINGHFDIVNGVLSRINSVNKSVSMENFNMYSLQFQDRGPGELLSESDSLQRKYALVEAIEDCHFEMVKRLVEAGASLDLDLPILMDPHTVIETFLEEYFRIVDYLLMAGMDLKLDKAVTWDLLLQASELGQYGILNHFLDQYGPAALCKAVRMHQTELIAPLLIVGADVNAHEPETGRTALHYAAQGGHLRSIQTLLAEGADVNACERDTGQTALHNAAQHNLFGVVKALVAAGAEVNAYEPRTGRTALHLAAERGFYRDVEDLLAAGANVDVKTLHTQRTALHLAVKRGRNLIVKYLIAAGADVNSTESIEGQTALHLAAKVNISIVRQLLAAEADVNAKTFKGFTARGIARAADIDYEIANLLAAFENNERIFSLEQTNQAALQKAAEFGNVVRVKQILKSRIRVDVNYQRPSDRMVALHIAAEKGHSEVVECLLSAGATVNAIGDYKSQTQTPLWVAAELGHASVVKQLLAAGADPAFGNRKAIHPSLMSDPDIAVLSEHLAGIAVRVAI